MDNNIDYNTEYKEYKRCFNCDSVTQGIDDYKNIRTGKVTKNCKKCRERVLISYNKKPRVTKKNPTNKEIIEAMKTIIDQINKEKLTEIINKPENKQIKKIYNYYTSD